VIKINDARHHPSCAYEIEMYNQEMTNAEVSLAPTIEEVNEDEEAVDGDDRDHNSGGSNNGNNGTNGNNGNNGDQTLMHSQEDEMSIICVPILNSENHAIGVIELIQQGNVLLSDDDIGLTEIFALQLSGKHCLF